MKPKTKSQICPFIEKLMNILQDPSSNQLISWASDDKGIIILNISKFTEEILPKYYKHQNFASFVRQLNIYGFFKASPDQNIYRNDKFLKGNLKSIKQIQRRPASTMVDCQNQKNEKKVKTEIQKELSDLKIKCTILENKCSLFEEKNTKLKQKNSETEKEIRLLKEKKQKKIKELEELVLNKYENEEINEDFMYDILSKPNFNNPERKNTFRCTEMQDELDEFERENCFQFSNSMEYIQEESEQAKCNDKIDYFSDPNIPLSMNQQNF